MYLKNHNILEIMEETFSITFGDQAENHVGMQMIGCAAKEGFSLKDIDLARKKFEDNGYECEQYNLHELLRDDNYEAIVLVIKNGINSLLGENGSDRLLAEMSNQVVDKKAKMRGRVVNKIARWNNCFGDIDQEADVENGKGTVISFPNVPELNKVRDVLPLYFGEKANKLVAETNRYYDLSKCGIGFHGDTERRIVICLRLGKSMPLQYQWFQNSKPVEDRLNIDLDHGDLYVMSEKATGFDWKKKKICTLRHAAGNKKYFKTK